MPRAKTSQQKLVAANSKQANQSDTSTGMPEFMHKMVHHPDPKEASDIVWKMAELIFDQDKGATLQRLEIEYQDLEPRYKASKQHLEELERDKNTTPREIKGKPRNSDGEERTPLKNWDWIDLIAIPFLTFSIGVALFMGQSNAYANLMGSGQPIFIENPWLAVSLSMLMPAASLSLKFTHHIFDHDRLRKRFTKTIYVLSLLALLAWSILFALNFQGISAEIDWDSLGQTNHTGTALVWVQLISEILIGGALSIALTEKLSIYFPNRNIENPEWIGRVKAFKEHEAAHHHLCKRYADIKTGITKLRGEREAFTFKQLATFNALCAQFNALC